MGNENSGRKVSRTVGHRKKLSDITNTPLPLKSRSHEESVQFAAKGSLSQLQEELANVKKMLEEKEEILADCKRCMEKLWFNYCRKSKQNNEIILHNSQLYKDLMQARDQLKILQHENTQMSALYRVCKLEMQEKLREALEQVDHLTKLVEVSSLQQASLHDFPIAAVPIQSSSGEITGKDSVNIHVKSLLRKREGEKKSYKEPSLKMKLRKADGDSICPTDSVQQDSNLAILELPATEWKQGEAPSDIVACYRPEMKQLSKNGPPMEVSQPDTVPDSSARGSIERPRRRAASSVGSYKEPSLATKMRRAA